MKDCICWQCDFDYISSPPHCPWLVSCQYVYALNMKSLMDWSQQTDIHPLLGQCWDSVVDVGPTLTQQWPSDPCLLSYDYYEPHDIGDNDSQIQLSIINNVIVNCRNEITEIRHLEYVLQSIIVCDARRINELFYILIIINFPLSLLCFCL